MADEPNPGGAPPEPPPFPHTPAPTPEPSAAPPASPPSGPPSLAGVKDYLVSQGVNAEVFGSDTAAVDALLSAAQQYQQNRQYVDIGKQAAPLWDDFEKFRQRGKPDGEPVPAEDPAWKWDRPEFDPNWLRYVDDNGRLLPDVNPIIGEKLARYVAWEQEKQREFLGDPQKIILGATDGRFRQLDKRFEGLQPGETIDQFIERKFEEKIAGYDARRQNETYFQEHLKEYYVTNEQGQPLRDPATGEYALTPKGKAFAQHAQEAQQFGLSDQNAIRQYAERLTAADEAQGRFASADNIRPTSVPAPPASEPRETFLEKALRDQATGGPVPAPNEPAPTDRILSAREIAEAHLRRHGDIP